MHNQVNLYSFSSAASEEDYESVADRWVDLSVQYDLAIGELSNPTEHSANSVHPDTYDGLIEALIESREIQVIMNRAQGNYYVPDDSPPPTPPPTPPRGADARGGIWGAAIILAVLGVVSSQWPIFLAAAIVAVYAIGHRAGSES